MKTHHGKKEYGRTAESTNFVTNTCRILWVHFNCTCGNTSADGVLGFNELHFQYDKIAKLEILEYLLRYQASNKSKFDNCM